MNKIRGVLVRPNRAAEVLEIENSHRGIRALIPGYIESVHISPDRKLVCLIDEEGRCKGMHPNILLLRGKEAVDYIVGDAFFVYSEGNDFATIPREHEKELLHQFSGKRHKYDLLNPIR